MLMTKNLRFFLSALFTLTLLYTLGYYSNVHASNNKNVANVENISKTLQTLTQYEIDESFIITQAIDGVKNQALKTKLGAIKQDCENNITELSAIISEHGREAPAHTRDFKGFFMQGYAAMRGVLSDQGVMKALHTNCQMNLKAFNEALNFNNDLPDELKERIRKKVYDVKKKNVDYISSQL